MTDQELQEYRKLCNEAIMYPDEPWVAEDEFDAEWDGWLVFIPGLVIASVSNKETAKFIAASRQMVPALLDEIERQRGVVKELECGKAIQQVVLDMAKIASDPDATPEEKRAALYTIAEALFPAPGFDLEDGARD